MEQAMAKEMPDDLKQWLEDLRIGSTEEDIARLKANISLLEEKELSELNKRLLSQSKRFHFLSTLTEHNFTANLLNANSSIQNQQINYEPNDTGGNRPPDLHINSSGINYWIQIKRFSQLKFRNMQSKIYDEIEDRVNSIEVPKFIDLQIASNFTNEDIEALITLIREKSNGDDEIKHTFNGKNKAEFTFRKPNKLELKNLTFGMLGDIGAIEITGLAKEQIKASLLKAAGAFHEDISQQNINLIVAELDGSSHDTIDLCEALYGTEFITFDPTSGKSFLHRDNDGLFNEPEFSKKVAGVISIRRKNNELIDDYWQVICSNTNNKGVIDSVIRLISIDKVVERFSNLGKGFFDLDE
jgi:hypothetical protein